MSGIVERLRDDAAQLARQIENAKLAGGETYVRVSDPSILSADLKEAADEIERLRAALREFNCPRPANDRPDDFEVGQCVDAGECGCGARFALTGEPVPGGIPAEDKP